MCLSGPYYMGHSWNVDHMDSWALWIDHSAHYHFVHILLKRVKHELGLCGKDIPVILLNMYGLAELRKRHLYFWEVFFSGHIPLSFMFLEGKLLSSCLFLDYFLLVFSDVLCWPDCKHDKK